MLKTFNTLAYQDIGKLQGKCLLNSKFFPPEACGINFCPFPSDSEALTMRKRLVILTIFFDFLTLFLVIKGIVSWFWLMISMKRLYPREMAIIRWNERSTGADPTFDSRAETSTIVINMRIVKRKSYQKVFWSTITTGVIFGQWKYFYTRKSK